MKINRNTMNEKEELLANINKLHTTEMGARRIARNLGLGRVSVVKYCKQAIQSPGCFIVRQGKNWYCSVDNKIITINASSYTIITARLV